MVYLSSDILAILIYCLTVLVVYHSYKTRGAYKTVALILAFLITGAGIENTNIIFGGYLYPVQPLSFPIYRCPAWVWLGWYLIAYCGSVMSHKIVGKGRGSLSIAGFGTKLENGIDKQFIKHTAVRALLTAYISMLIGLIMDPTAAWNDWWVWKVANIYVHRVPFGNYIGWCLVVFWTLFIYEIIISWASIKEKKEIITSTYLAIGSSVALLLAGISLMLFTFWFGLEGIQTETPDTKTYLSVLITNVDLGELLIAVIVVLIGIGLMMASSFLPNRMPEVILTDKIWYISPPIFLLVYWVVMMVVTVLTSFVLVAAGILNGIPLFILCFYMIKNPNLEAEPKKG